MRLGGPGSYCPRGDLGSGGRQPAMAQEQAGRLLGFQAKALAELEDVYTETAEAQELAAGIGDAAEARQWLRTKLKAVGEKAGFPSVLGEALGQGGPLSRSPALAPTVSSPGRPGGSAPHSHSGTTLLTMSSPWCLVPACGVRAGRTRWGRGKRKACANQGQGPFLWRKIIRKLHASHRHIPLAHFSHMATPHPEEPGKLPLHNVLPQKGHNTLASEGRVPLLSRLDPVKGESECVPATLTRRIKGMAPPQCPLAASQHPSAQLQLSLGPPSFPGLAHPLPALPSSLRPGHWAGQSQGSFPGLTLAGPARAYRYCERRQAPHHPHPCRQVLHLQLETGQLW